MRRLTYSQEKSNFKLLIGVTGWVVQVIYKRLVKQNHQQNIYWLRDNDGS